MVNTLNCRLQNAFPPLPPESVILETVPATGNATSVGSARAGGQHHPTSTRSSCPNKNANDFFFNKASKNKMAFPYTPLGLHLVVMVRERKQWERTEKSFSKNLMAIPESLSVYPAKYCIYRRQTCLQ